MSTAHAKHEPTAGVVYLRDLSSAMMDAYECDGVYYAVPIGSRVSQASLVGRHHSPTLASLQPMGLRVQIGRWEEHAPLDVKARPYPHSEVMPRAPMHAAFSHDRSCNISCPSCRVAIFTATRAEQKSYDEVLPGILSFLKGTHFITVTGGGDPFASRHYRQMLKKMKGSSEAKIILHTNALLFDERAWNELELADRVELVTISIDAARPETYERIRRGSRWPILLERLEFIARLRREGRIGFLDTNYTVQRSNFREMPAFVDFALSYGFDRIKFSMVRNIGAYTTSSYENENIGAAVHPDHDEFVAMLKDPVFDDPRVNLGNCSIYLDDAGGLDAHDHALPSLIQP